MAATGPVSRYSRISRRSPPSKAKRNRDAISAVGDPGDADPQRRREEGREPPERPEVGLALQVTHRDSPRVKVRMQQLRVELSGWNGFHHAKRRRNV